MNINDPHYDWQAEVIARIERAGGDPSDEETWRRVAAEVWADEQANADDSDLNLLDHW